MAKVTVRVSDDAPPDLALNGTALAAGSEVEVEAAQVALLGAHVTLVEAAEPAPKAKAEKTAAVKKGKR